MKTQSRFIVTIWQSQGGDWLWSIDDEQEGETALTGNGSTREECEEQSERGLRQILAAFRDDMPAYWGD